MSVTSNASAAQKSAYQRPYKTRNQRRETARRKHDENADQKFLWRAALVAGVLLLLAIGFAMKASVDHEATAPAIEAQS